MNFRDWALLFSSSVDIMILARLDISYLLAIYSVFYTFFVGSVILKFIGFSSLNILPSDPKKYSLDSGRTDKS